VALAGCAASPTKVSSNGPAPVLKQSAATPLPVRDSHGHLVTLADLTQGNPTIGETEGLADSTPGETALEAASASTASVPSSDFDNLEIVGDSLKGKLAVTRVGSDRTDANLLSVFAGVKNQTGRRLELEMQTLYRDKNGNPLSGGGASWIPITLKPHEETQYRSVALSQEAADFQVRIRRASSPGTDH
jgi:hypothetical protein